MSLDAKTCVVTGAGSGIGRAIALQLAVQGYRVCVTDINLHWAIVVVDEIVASGGEAFALELDVTEAAHSQAAVATLVDRWGHLDIWCNNAGISTMNHFLDLTEWDWDYNLSVNAKGTFLCSQAAARQMVNQPPQGENQLRGKIINIASMAGKRGNAPFLVHYVASKFAVVGLTQAMAGELAAHGITVNAVCPGYVRTEMQAREIGWEAALRGVDPEQVKQLYINDTPLGRLETPEDVAGVVTFLASSAADFITGEAINVNGGSWMD